MLPRRSRTHEIETESRNFVRSALPSSWIVEDVDLDYGTDIRVEIVDDGRPTGLLFLIQVKGHESAQVMDGFVVEDLDVRHLNYYQRLVIPVFLVVYDCSTKSAVYLDVKDYVETVLDSESPGWEFQKTVRVHIPAGDNLQDGHGRIANSVREFFALHGLGKRVVLPSPTEAFMGSLVLRLASGYPERRSFSKLLHDTRKASGIRKGVGPTSKQVNERLSGIAVFEEAGGELLIRLLEPTRERLGIVSGWTKDDDLVLLLDSPWARSLDDPYFSAFITMVRVRRNKDLTGRINSHHFSHLDFYFALLEELMAAEPDLLLEIKGVLAESLIQSVDGEQVVRSTSFRFSDAGMNRSYEEFCLRKESEDWFEVVETSGHYALVRLRSPDPEARGPVLAKTIERKDKRGKVSFTVLESTRKKSAILVDIPVLRRNAPRRQPLMSMYSEVANFEFRGGPLSSLAMIGGQEVGVKSFAGPGGIGARLEVDGVPVFEILTAVDISKIQLPPNVRRSIENMGEDSSFPITVVSFSKSDVEREEMTGVIGQVIEVLQQRYEDLIEEH